ncbi:MAG: PEFG-CTERM sorting domain-containing protein [Thaumarchaeota archaeon]|nr:PEFG-CTERM sorting domain-containing protein [Nitrososphaerota archaeon]
MNVSITPTTGSAPLQVTYKASLASGGSMKSIVWNFGDGSSLSGVTNGTHTYASAGNYTGTVDADAMDGTSYTQTFAVSATGSIGANIGANVTVPNPKTGTVTAYQLLQQEHNGSLVATSLPPLSVQTDALSYSQGDTIIIHGTVKDVSNQTAVTVRVVNDLKNMVSIAQLIPSSDGSFSTKVLATGPLWTKPGNYTVIAQYGPLTNATTLFQFGGGDGTTRLAAPPISSTFSLQTSAGTFNIPYTIRGGTVQSIQLQGQQHVLVISINAPSNGSLSIDIPRALIDSKAQPPVPTGPNQTSTTQINQSELPDQPFTVQVGGQNVQVTETSDLNSRTLGIPFHKGDTTIDVMGTVSVPEFGPIAALVFAIAIVSIIAVSAKTGLRFLPKY